jgi:hypothetical protein
VSALRAPRVEEEIVKVPENEVVVALGRPEATVAGGVDLEKDLAIHQQSEQLGPRETFPAFQPFDLLGRRQYRDGGRCVRIANPEQRAGARRFEDHLVAAPSQVCEPRQDENVGIAEVRRSRPIIGDLRFDDDMVLAVSRAPELVLQQTVPGQSPDQEINLLVDAPGR